MPIDIHYIFRHLFHCSAVFSTALPSAVTASSSKPEELNDCKESKLQMLCGAKAKSESSVRFFFF